MSIEDASIKVNEALQGATAGCGPAHRIVPIAAFENIPTNELVYYARKEAQITGLISELKPLINDIGDATLIVPLIKEYMEIGVRNDEQLIKMATIVQRALNNSGSDDALGITEAEKEELGSL